MSTRRRLSESEVVLAEHDHGNLRVAAPTAGERWATYIVWGDGAPDYATDSSALTGRLDYEASSWDELLEWTADRVGKDWAAGLHEELIPLVVEWRRQYGGGPIPGPLASP